jgi:hypothetical protein
MRYGDYERACSIWKRACESIRIEGGRDIAYALRYANEVLNGDPMDSMASFDEITSVQSRIKSLYRTASTDPYACVVLEVLGGIEKKKYVDHNIEEFLWQKLVGAALTKDSIGKCCYSES